MNQCSLLRCGLNSTKQVALIAWITSHVVGQQTVSLHNKTPNVCMYHSWIDLEEEYLNIKQHFTIPIYPTPSILESHDLSPVDFNRSLSGCLLCSDRSIIGVQQMEQQLSSLCILLTNILNN